ncbi:TetR family transcriptional regulator [Mycolicibacterium sp. 22603]|uniref:TetR family transcriptional regulator n=1 Tax=Mycolicibacterium sp. 22603 TaxID=3453950 RepID=UPI003F872770
MVDTHLPGNRVRDAEATRMRLLAAGRAEFARRGLAGARIDSIAEAAQANKRMIYAYFDSKTGLFNAVIEANIAALLEEVPFDATDLGGYAVAYFDQLLADPIALRLTLWRSVEGGPALPEERLSYARKLDAIRSAQRDGFVVPDLDPADVLAMLFSLARSWLSAADALRAEASQDPDSDRRLSDHRKALRAVVCRALTTER